MKPVEKIEEGCKKALAYNPDGGARLWRQRFSPD
jgi:hypothetical protein